MAMKLQISEILQKLTEFTGKDSATKKVEWLKKNDSATLRMILQHAFDPNVVYDLPEGIPPYKVNESPIGLTETTLFTETRKLSYLWTKPSDTAIKTTTNEQSSQLTAIGEEQKKRRDALSEAEATLTKLIQEYRDAEELIRTTKIKLVNLMDDGKRATLEVNRLKQAVAEIDTIAANTERNILSNNRELQQRNEQRELSNKALNIPKYKREMLFIELLEGLHKDDAQILLAVKDKTLNKKYPITKDIVKKAFPDIGL